jgi:phytoene synthase
MELTHRRFATWAALERFLHHSRGVLGPILCAVLGVRHSDAPQHAAQLAVAIALIERLRNLREDAMSGRICLPLEDMVRCGYSEPDLMAAKANDAFGELMKLKVARARELLCSGAEGICWLASDGSRMAVATVAVMYGAVLREIERRRYDVLSSRVELTTGQKVRRIPAAWRLARRQADEPLPGVF